MIPPGDREARRAWKRIAPALLEARLLTRLDEVALGLLCLGWSDYLKARSGKRGGAAAARCVLSLLAEFGMSPSSRTRIHVPPIDGPDELDEFLARNAALRNRPDGGAA